MSNPVAMPKALKGYTQGVRLIDAGAAAGGLAFTAWLAPLVVKDTLTTAGKAMRIGAGIGSSMLAGFVAGYLDKRAAQMAVAGGLATTTLQALEMAGLSLKGTKMLTGGKTIRRLGTSTVVSPAVTREQETVSIITP